MSLLSVPSSLSPSEVDVSEENYTGDAETYSPVRQYKDLAKEMTSPADTVNTVGAGTQVILLFTEYAPRPPKATSSTSFWISFSANNPGVWDQSCHVKHETHGVRGSMSYVTESYEDAWNTWRSGCLNGFLLWDQDVSVYSIFSRVIHDKDVPAFIEAWRMRNVTIGNTEAESVVINACHTYTMTVDGVRPIELIPPSLGTKATNVTRKSVPITTSAARSPPTKIAAMFTKMRPSKLREEVYRKTSGKAAAIPFVWGSSTSQKSRAPSPARKRAVSVHSDSDGDTDLHTFKLSLPSTDAFGSPSATRAPTPGPSTSSPLPSLTTTSLRWVVFAGRVTGIYYSALDADIATQGLSGSRVAAYADTMIASLKYVEAYQNGALQEL